jgi:hypothetical protein
MFETTTVDVIETTETPDVAAAPADQDAGDEPEREYLGTATYSLSDNKLRFYPFRRLGPATYARVKDAGFSWAPKQEVFVAGMWTPEREDLLVELCGDIEEEDITPEERAERRAERFEEYSENAGRRASAAHRAVEAICDGIPLGQPILCGHHSERRARKDQERIQNGMRKVVNEMKSSAYWADRAKASLHHAKYLEKPAVRARRIKTIEADKRKQERTKADAEKFTAMWTDPAKELTPERAKDIANYCHVSQCFPLDRYPRELPASQYEGRMSLWSAMEGIITPEQARDIAVRAYGRRIASCDRWIQHYENRLTFERAMLGEQGGIATDKVGPEKGGAVRCWCSPGHGRGWSYIKKVNKVSVTVEDNWGNGGKNFTRTIPFDKIRAVMTAAQVEEARARGPEVFAESAYKDGFFLGTDPVPSRPSTKVEPPAWAAIEEAAKNVQAVAAPELFPTPPGLVERMWDEALAATHPCCIRGNPEGCKALEPSAGTGAIADKMKAAGLDVHCVEINMGLTQGLLSKGYSVTPADFLGIQPAENYDLVMMNPPFSADVAHVRHAYGFLKPGGRLVAIMSEGPFFRSYRADVEFRAWLDEIGGVSEQLPPDTFKASGTGVNVRLVTISK